MKGSGAELESKTVTRWQISWGSSQGVGFAEALPRCPWDEVLANLSTGDDSDSRALALNGTFNISIGTQVDLCRLWSERFKLDSKLPQPSPAPHSSVQAYRAMRGCPARKVSRSNLSGHLSKQRVCARLSVGCPQHLRVRRHSISIISPRSLANWLLYRDLTRPALASPQCRVVPLGAASAMPLSPASMTTRRASSHPTSSLVRMGRAGSGL